MLDSNTLLKKYPFLRPYSLYTGKIYEGNDYTWLDEIPKGWREKFGEQWAEEISQYISTLSKKEQENFRILQLKEKFGVFTQYFSHYSESLTNIINKYEQLSKNTCCECGAPATHISTDWICPWCKQHAPEGSQLIMNVMEQ